MQVEIQEVSSTVRAVDREALVSPQVLERIVAAVMHAIKASEAHERRASGERAITGGVSAERDAE